MKLFFREPKWFAKNAEKKNSKKTVNYIFHLLPVKIFIGSMTADEIF